MPLYCIHPILAGKNSFRLTFFVLKLIGFVGVKVSLKTTDNFLLVTNEG